MVVQYLCSITEVMDMTKTFFAMVFRALGLVTSAVLMGGVFFLMLGLLFSVTFVIGYLVTVRSGVGIDTLVFAGIVLTSFVALTDRAREGVMSKAAERVSDASAFGCVFLGFLCSSMTATSSIQSRCLLIAVAVASLFFGLWLRQFYIRWRAARRTARA
jgi:hypothetical protein